MYPEEALLLGLRLPPSIGAASAAGAAISVAAGEKDGKAGE